MNCREAPLSSTELHNFIDEYIVNNFLPHMKTDFSKRTEKALEGSYIFQCHDRKGTDAFKIPDKQKLAIASEDSSKTILQVFTIIKYL